MPVIINDFEIVVEPPEPRGGSSDEERAAPPEPNALAPEDIVQVMRLHEERMRRLRAN